MGGNRSQRLSRGDIAYITIPAEPPAGVDPASLRTIRIEATKNCEFDFGAHEAVKIAIVRPPKTLTRNRHRL